MTEVIALIVFLLCLMVLFRLSWKDSFSKKHTKESDDINSRKEKEIENHIQKIEDVYGEKAVTIMFQELSTPHIAELLIILEEAQIILILGEGYNFSEILNIRIGQLNYIRSKRTKLSSSPVHILERAASGEFSSQSIKEALEAYNNGLECIFDSKIEKNTEIEIMTSRQENPIISITPSCHTMDEVIIALAIIIDKNEQEWTSVEIPKKRT